MPKTEPSYNLHSLSYKRKPSTKDREVILQANQLKGSRTEPSIAKLLIQKKPASREWRFRLLKADQTVSLPLLK